MLRFMEDRSSRAFLRHTVATVAYRAAKALNDTPADFAHFKISDTSRTPIQILGHLGDLIDWALTLAQGNEAWKEVKTESWQQASDRFFGSLKMLDDFLASGQPLACNSETLFQGPIADALTHVGQIAMLRRVNGRPVRGENYSRANIEAGRVVPQQQSRPEREFD